MDDDFKLSEGQKWLMFGVAVFFDIISLVSLIPAIGWVLELFVWLFATMTFWLWFKMKGMRFSKPKNLLSFTGGSIVELTPLGFIPAWTFTILYLTRVEKIIDKTIKQVPGGAIINKKIERNTKVIGINQDIKKQMAGFNSSGTNNINAKNTGRPNNNGTYNLNEKNKNTQGSAGKITQKQDDITPNTNRESKEKTNQSSGDKNNTQSRNEIDNLKKDIGRYKEEIQQLEPQITETKRRLDEALRTMNDMISLAKEGHGTGKTPQEVYQIHQEGMIPLQNKNQSLNQKVNRLKDIVFSMNNKLMDLERKAGPKR